MIKKPKQQGVSTSTRPATEASKPTTQRKRQAIGLPYAEQAQLLQPRGVVSSQTAARGVQLKKDKESAQAIRAVTLRTTGAARCNKGGTLGPQIDYTNAHEMVYAVDPYYAAAGRYRVRRTLLSENIWIKQGGTYTCIHTQAGQSDDPQPQHLCHGKGSIHSFDSPGIDVTSMFRLAKYFNDPNVSEIVVRQNFRETCQVGQWTSGYSIVAGTKKVDWHNVVTLTRDAASKKLVRGAPNRTALGHIATKPGAGGGKAKPPGGR